MKGKIRVGIIGLGTMGQGHLHTLCNGLADYCEVTAVCDIASARFNESKIKELLNVNIKTFSSYKDLIDSKLCDAVIVVTPHPIHPEISIYAFRNGLHVLCDKPVGIKVSDVEKMISEWKKTKLKFSTMYSMRTNPANILVKEFITQGKLGKIQRVDMVSTKWLRTQKYYDEQTWRGTWDGEGGGLLMNQAPHNLDLLYWWFGEASSITAEVSKRFHKIETEDEVDAKIKTKAGFPISFYATTGEAPGIDRVEIVGTRGTLIREGRTAKALVFLALKEDVEKTIYESEKTIVEPVFERKEIEIPDFPRGDKIVFQSFFDAIINDRPNSNMIAPGDEGIHSLEWANAMLMSSLEKHEIKLPLDKEKYNKILKNLQNGKIKL